MSVDFLWHYDSPLGRMTLASDGGRLTGLWFDGQAHFGENLSSLRENRCVPVILRTMEWLDMYFCGREPDWKPDLFLRATDFRRRVWEEILTIPRGQTVSYRELAGRTWGTEYTRAVSGAVARNPISLIIPCHRVVGQKGLTGYAGGLDRKRRLLEMEQAPGDQNPMESLTRIT